MTRSSSSKQFQIGNKRYQRWYVSNYFFWRKKSTFPHRSYRLDIFFTEEAAAIDIVWIRYLSSGPQRTLYHRLFTNVPSIRCLSSDLQTKKPSKLRSKDIRIVFLQRQTVFQDFPPKLDLLTIVMLIGIRHCQVTVPNYCDNDCMFVMFISSSNEEKYA